ncbi:MAG: abortive infection system antitoxin AbiGi family protein, partial [Bacteroidia bacterium]|nr:abortive infection system antitoxin AbiGi family protein [Bacteroidia bacterium]
MNYSYNESQRSSSLRILVEYYFKQSRRKYDKLIQEFKNALNILLMTSKPYEGRRYQKTSKSWSDEKIRFYDEREWRFLPLVNKMDWSVTLENENYDNLYKEIERIQPNVQAKYKLNFSVNDIVY